LLKKRGFGINRFFNARTGSRWSRFSSAGFAFLNFVATEESKTGMRRKRAS
jgi:hypothetical protein